MRLSEAIALGRVLITTPNPDSYCGCAIGMGLAAQGKTYGSMDDTGRAFGDATRMWPWLRKEIEVPSELRAHEYLRHYCEHFSVVPAYMLIGAMFFQVMAEKRTLESLIDWVRSVEPAEQPALETEQAVATQAVHAEVVAKNL